jgi:hypothetical protein
MATLCKAGVTLRAQLDAAFPNRDKRSDGWIGDKAHQAKGKLSDHNPDSNGIVHAIDVDENFGTGTARDGANAEQFCKELLAYAASGKQGANRIKNVVYENRVASGTYKDKLRFWRWRKGNYGHTGHVHISFTNAADTNGKPFPLPILKVVK